MARIALFLSVLALGGGAALVSASCVGDSGAEVTGCPPLVRPDNTDVLGDGTAYARVSEVIERRCGTLDCHGQASRPLRIYGSSGLRRPEPDLGTKGCQSKNDCPGAHRDCLKGVGCVDDAIKTVDDYADYYPGGAIITTPSERRANWESMCSLEPEIMTLVYCCADKAHCTGYPFEQECTDKDAFAPKQLTLVRKARLLEKHKGGLIWNEGDAGDLCLTSWLTGQYDAPDVKAAKCDEELQHP